MAQQRSKHSDDDLADELAARLAGPIDQLGATHPLAIVAFALRSGLRVRRLMVHWMVSQGMTLALRIGQEYCLQPDGKSRATLAKILGRVKWELDAIERHAPLNTVPYHVENSAVARLNEVVHEIRQGNISSAGHWAKFAARNAFEAARLAVKAGIVPSADLGHVERGLVRDVGVVLPPREEATIDPGPDGPFGPLWESRDHCPSWEPSEQWHQDLTRIRRSVINGIVDQIERQARLDQILEAAKFPERPGSAESLEWIGRCVEKAADPFPEDFTLALREGLPVDRAVSILSAQADAMHRPIAEALRGLLTRLHEAKSLGSYEKNARATTEVYRLAKACNVDLVFEGQVVSIDCRPREDVKAGIFKLRTLQGSQRYIYQRTVFPLLDLQASERSSNDQKLEPAAEVPDVGRAVSALSEQVRAAHRPVVDELRGLLSRLHEAKNLGSYEENARAAAEVYRLAKDCNVDLVYEGTRVSLMCRNKKNYKTGVFKLRELGAQKVTKYERVYFPRLDVSDADNR